tara:strand:+ start:196 stop:660 length:465 start_codon:yes stop_codon:yes gene_type:complete
MKELQDFKDLAGNSRRFLLISTFLWIGIYEGPSNIYIILTALILMVRGLLYFLIWRREIKILEEKFNESFVVQNQKGEFENPYLKYKKNYIEFKERANTEFLLLIVIYVFGLLFHFSNINEWPSFLAAIFVGIAGCSIFVLLGMSLREIGQDQD